MTDETKTETTESPESATATETAAGPEKLDQEVEISDAGPCKKHIKVKVDRTIIEGRMNVKFSELVVDSNVAGFRPGKAPRKIIEKRFAKDVGDQVKAEVMLQSLQQLSEEHDIAPLSTPDIDPTKVTLPKEGPLFYEFDVEVRPQFELPEYKKLKLKRPVHSFTTEDVAEQQRRLLAPFGKLVPKPQGNARIGDSIVANVKIEAGGKLVSTHDDVLMGVDRQLAFRDAVAGKFLEQVQGAKAGETRKVALLVSESAADASLRGKTILAILDIKEIQEVRLPELTNELLHEFSVHTPAQLLERVGVVLEHRLEYIQRQSARQQILERITAASTWDLPQDLLERQARISMARRTMEMRASGMSQEEIKGQLRLLQNDILQSTSLALKEHFVLQKIAEVEKLDVSDDDMNSEIERIAMENNESPRRIRARLEKEQVMDAFAIELTERKVLDLIIQHAEFEDVQIDALDDSSVANIDVQAIPGEMRKLAVD